MNITTVSETEIDSLQPLVAEFVRAHPSLPFRDNHWQAFRTWLKKGVELGNMTSGPFWHKRGFETFLEKRRLL